ncbi:hypothetical protein B0H17DRAFT_1178655 [Mycena rosella]|uniref:Uncharacterized protein n=1 Tax=Mycena rosella TaxID=1033263 RepID=A0AAD7DLH0_MYCRO|nr:hypothetical protein B0H17DRAFT_1178655 [Mycena rosella]
MTGLSHPVARLAHGPTRLQAHAQTPSTGRSRSTRSATRRSARSSSSGESGKSTIVKQMKIIHQAGFSPQEHAKYRTTIYKNVLDSAGTLARVVRRVGAVGGGVIKEGKGGRLEGGMGEPEAEMRGYADRLLDAFPPLPGQLALDLALDGDSEHDHEIEVGVDPVPFTRAASMLPASHSALSLSLALSSSTSGGIETGRGGCFGIDARGAHARTGGHHIPRHARARGGKARGRTPGPHQLLRLHHRIAHLTYVPALPPSGGRPPISTTCKTSMSSSCTRPAHAEIRDRRQGRGERCGGGAWLHGDREGSSHAPPANRAASAAGRALFIQQRSSVSIKAHSYCYPSADAQNFVDAGLDLRDVRAAYTLPRRR